MSFYANCLNLTALMLYIVIIVHIYQLELFLRGKSWI